MTADIIPVKFSKPQMEILRRTVASGVTSEEFYFFLEVCKARGLNPFNREIYAIPREGKMTIQIGIDGLRLLAERSGKYRGQLGPFFCGPDGVWKEEWIDDEPPVAAKVGIKRPDFDKTMWAVARYKSYVQCKSDGTPTKSWVKFPDILLAKCAEALCIRKTYPAEVAGLYVNEEMMQGDRGPERTFVRPTVDADASANATEEDTEKPPTIMQLFNRWQNELGGKESADFYTFMSNHLGFVVNRENALSVSHEQRESVARAIDSTFAEGQAAVERVLAQPDDNGDDGYVSMDQISQELAEQKQSA